MPCHYRVIPPNTAARAIDRKCKRCCWAILREKLAFGQFFQILLAGATCMLPYRAPHIELAPHIEPAPWYIDPPCFAALRVARQWQPYLSALCGGASIPTAAKSPVPVPDSVPSAAPPWLHLLTTSHGVWKPRLVPEVWTFFIWLTHRPVFG